MLLSIASICLSMALYAQQDKTIKADDFVHKSSETYEYPTDPEVLKKLEQWQDQNSEFCFIGEFIQYVVRPNHGDYAQNHNLGCTEAAKMHMMLHMESLKSGIGGRQKNSILLILNRPIGRKR